MHTIDINCDMGEKAGNDEYIMPYISSANISCGYHAGDEDEIKRTVELALIHKVSIGAHPGYDDKINFGRVELGYSNEKIVDLILEQLYIFNKITKASGGKMAYVKLHGALYNKAALDETLAKAIVTNVSREFKDLSFLTLAMSKMIDVISEMKGRAYHEVFADRAYTNDRALVPRKEAGALITDIASVKERVKMMVMDKRVYDINGDMLTLHCDSICVHGDGEHAMAFVKTMYDFLKSEGIIIENFL